MTHVLDASVAVKWVVPEPDADKARLLEGERLIAPAIWLAEAAAALARKQKDGELAASEALSGLASLSRAPIVVSDHPGDLMAAMEIAGRLRHPLYDCLYLAVARREGVKLITADARFVRAARRVPDLADGVVLLSDYADPGAAG
jgi:predicted nucleic acid-binding protein